MVQTNLTPTPLVETTTSVEIITDSEEYLSNTQENISPTETQTYKGNEFIYEVGTLLDTLKQMHGQTLGVDEYENFNAWKQAQFSLWQGQRLVSAERDENYDLTAFEVAALMNLVNIYETSTQLPESRAGEVRLIIIDGGSGPGKTAAIEELKTRGLPLGDIGEDVDGNHYLAPSKEHDTAEQAAFGAQLHFRLGKLNNITTALTNPDTESMLADRFFRGDEAHIETHRRSGNIDEHEHQLLNQILDLFQGIIPPAENTTCVFLYAEPAVLAKRLVKRGNRYEIGDNVTVEYLAEHGYQPGKFPELDAQIELQDAALTSLGIQNNMIPIQEVKEYTQKDGSTLVIMNTSDLTMLEVATSIHANVIG